jgi:hypothetical protein
LAWLLLTLEQGKPLAEANGTRRPDLEGAEEPDLSVTPFALPVPSVPARGPLDSLPLSRFPRRAV